MLKHWICFSCAAATIALSSTFIFQDGAKWRIPDERVYPSSNEMRNMESALCNNTHIINGTELGNEADEPIITCSHNTQSSKNIYVWGDSHARHLLPGLVSNFPNYNIHILYFTSCLAQSGIKNFIYEYENRTALRDACVSRNKRAMEFFKKRKSDHILIHQYFGYKGQFSESWHASTNHIIEELSKYGHRIAFIGAVTRPMKPLGDCIAVPITIPENLLSWRCKGDQEVQKEVFELNDELEKNLGNFFINTNNVLCKSSMNCISVEGSNLIYRDNHHLTLYGSNKLISGIRNNINKIFNP